MENDYNTFVLIARGLERVLVVLIGGALLYFGYKLFHHSASTKTKLDAKYQTLSLSLESTAPGIYFCLFGTALLAFTVVTQVTVSETEDSGSGTRKVTIFGASSDSTGQNSQLYEAVKSISTLEHLALTSDRIEPDDLLRISDHIEPLRAYFISNEFGSEAYQNFLLIRQECRRGNELCNSLMPRLMDQAEYVTIESLFDPDLEKLDE